MLLGIFDNEKLLSSKEEMTLLELNSIVKMESKVTKTEKYLKRDIHMINKTTYGVITDWTKEVCKELNVETDIQKGINVAFREVHTNYGHLGIDDNDVGFLKDMSHSDQTIKTEAHENIVYSILTRWFASSIMPLVKDGKTNLLKNYIIEEYLKTYIITLPSDTIKLTNSNSIFLYNTLNKETIEVKKSDNLIEIITNLQNKYTDEPKDLANKVIVKSLIDGTIGDLFEKIKVLEIENNSLTKQLKDVKLDVSYKEFYKKEMEDYSKRVATIKDSLDIANNDMSKVIQENIKLKRNEQYIEATKESYKEVVRELNETKVNFDEIKFRYEEEQKKTQANFKLGKFILDVHRESSVIKKLLDDKFFDGELFKESAKSNLSNARDSILLKIFNLFNSSEHDIIKNIDEEIEKLETQIQEFIEMANVLETLPNKRREKSFSLEGMTAKLKTLGKAMKKGVEEDEEN